MTATGARSVKAGAQRQHSLEGEAELTGVEAAVLQRVGEGGDGVLALADVTSRAQQHIHPGPRGQDAALGRGSETGNGAGLERVGDGHAGEPEPTPELTLDDRW